ncbi:MAG: hypothetical protein LQ351_005463 [Letrouitia transgressa]|nr:MAG: hypothetical protein LQ351_005463 [Letrouitia transgressa]
MPARTAAIPASETEEQLGGTPSLRFNEPLSWRAGKQIPVADLLRRLQALSKEMQELEQEDFERESLDTVAKELASPNLLAHKDKGVKALTASCLVDVLRLCAPDAPYTGQQLRDIFSMIITQILPALADTTNAYNNQHLYVLNSLALVKSIVLLTDIPSSDTLTRNVFQICFDVLSGTAKEAPREELQKNVEINMTQLLVSLVDESATLPPEVIDIIVAQFLRMDPRAIAGASGKGKKNGIQLDEKQSLLVLKQLPPAYNMAKYICNACPEKMARYISQYFNDVIVDASKFSASAGANKSKRRHGDDLSDSDDEYALGPTEEDLRELRKVHGLLRELWRACPAVLQNVVPQLEAELSTENVQLRLLATDTLGDIISGIGAAGVPTPPALDSSAYPPNTLSKSPEDASSFNLLTKPSSPQPFPHAHPQAYSNYLGRRHDKSPLVRSTWTTGIGRILTTCAGGAGLSQQEEDRLIDDLSRMMGDADEKVRIAAVRVVNSFTFRDIIWKLGRSGGITKPGSVLATLAERVRDRKHTVREEAMTVLGRAWGVALGEIAANNEQVTSLIGGAPSKIFDTYYTNDPEIMALLDSVFFKQLLPLAYPSIKSRSSRAVNGNSQRTKESQGADQEPVTTDPDKIRTERILILLRSLDERAKKVFFTIQSRQLVLAKVMNAYLARCEDYNGGVMDENEAQVKEHLTRLIKNLAGNLPSPAQATADLWKFAKMHDRRSYQLIRFCMAPESDYRTVFKANKEFTKRIAEATSSTTASTSLLGTLSLLLYRVSLIVYNKSHVPAIMAFSKSDENSLAGAAHEILREISLRTPEVLKAHVQEICKYLQDNAPSSTKSSDAGALDNLKACASFASKYGNEMPKDRKFLQAMTSFALFGSPPEAAKYAVSVSWAVSDKKDLLAKSLVQKCVKDFQYGADGFLSRLATLSQLVLLAPDEVEGDSDAITNIAIKQILLQVRQPANDPSRIYEWSETADDECLAKCWALKILVNRTRSHPTLETLSEVATSLYNLLYLLVHYEGELPSVKGTPPGHKSRLRLLAARSYLKLCTKKSLDPFLTPDAFNSLATVAQDGEQPVRAGFMQRLKKYLGQQRLPQRFHTIPFLLAFEPSDELRSDTVTWIKSRAVAFSSSQVQQKGSSKANIVMESVFARLLSLLAHHPDYDSNAEDLIDFARYIIFYLQSVATEENLSLIYHIAQRVKQCRDTITPAGAVAGTDTLTSYDDRLYHLSDLAQLTIRKYEDLHNWNIQTLPAKVRLPGSLFSEIKSHDDAQRVAERSYLPDEVDQGVDELVRASVRAGRSGYGKKRKSDSGEQVGREHKKVKSLPIRKSDFKKREKRFAGAATKPGKAKRAAETQEEGEHTKEKRRSGRSRVVETSYVERDSDEDDAEMQLMDQGDVAGKNDGYGGNNASDGDQASEADNADHQPRNGGENTDEEEAMEEDDEEEKETPEPPREKVEQRKPPPKARPKRQKKTARAANTRNKPKTRKKQPARRNAAAAAEDIYDLPSSPG